MPPHELKINVFRKLILACINPKIKVLFNIVFDIQIKVFKTGVIGQNVQLTLMFKVYCLKSEKSMHMSYSFLFT